VTGIGIDERAVLPTPGKTCLPDLNKNSAAGEKIRPSYNTHIEDNIIGFFSQCKMVGKN
jgi:hypothetical protein